LNDKANIVAISSAQFPSIGRLQRSWNSQSTVEGIFTFRPGFEALVAPQVLCRINRDAALDAVIDRGQ
jgi:hypothetical protein